MRDVDFLWHNVVQPRRKINLFRRRGPLHGPTSSKQHEFPVLILLVGLYRVYHFNELAALIFFE